MELWGTRGISSRLALVEVFDASISSSLSPAPYSWNNTQAVTEMLSVGRKCMLRSLNLFRNKNIGNWGIYYIASILLRVGSSLGSFSNFPTNQMQALERKRPLLPSGDQKKLENGIPSLFRIQLMGRWPPHFSGVEQGLYRLFYFLANMTFKEFHNIQFFTLPSAGSVSDIRMTWICTSY